MSGKTVTILLVEDDEVDVMAIRRAFKKQKIANPIQVAKNGLEALLALRNHQVEAPFIILLDLNMPRMNGIEFLSELRSDPELSKTVVFVLTTSDTDKDRVAAYEQQVAGYIVKQNAGDGFVELLKMLDCYWRVVTLP